MTFGEFAGKEGDIVSGVVQQGQRPARTCRSTSARSRPCCRRRSRCPASATSTAPGCAATSCRCARACAARRSRCRAPTPTWSRKLFALEVPGDRRRHRRDRRDRARGRSPHRRSRCAPTAPGVNAKGACIGPMGSRVRSVMAELHGEKIDIVDWSEDPAEFVAQALSPARVSVGRGRRRRGPRRPGSWSPTTSCPSPSARKGQNARLAARLTGWRIDIHPDTEGGCSRAPAPARTPGPPRSRSAEPPRALPEPAVGPAQPMRTCVGCRARAPRSELLRVVLTQVDGTWTLQPDPRRTLPGRGASLHPTAACLDLAERRRAFGRSLRYAGRWTSPPCAPTCSELTRSGGRSSCRVRRWPALDAREYPRSRVVGHTDRAVCARIERVIRASGSPVVARAAGTGADQSSWKQVDEAVLSTR